MLSLLLPVIYLSFISLGLPDSVLGSAWPTMQPLFGAQVCDIGIVSFIISLGTVISSLLSDRLTKRLGTGRLTLVSVFMTATALLGFSASSRLWMLCVWAVPYGLGAGSVDAALNNYVALHYASRHMSWLHCMWGVGASIGPLIMGAVLTSGKSWSIGYLSVGFIQLAVGAVLVFSLPLWKKIASEKCADADSAKPVPLGEVLKISGSKQIMLAFFCYCGIEQSAILWGSSFLISSSGISSDTAASLASLYCLGLTFGRAVSGFVTLKLSDTAMIRLGQGLMAAGMVLMLLPLDILRMAGLILVGLGSAPVYPCIIHSTPVHFGADRSQAVVGIQMASAYLGVMAVPPFFGIIAETFTASVLPLFMLIFLAVMVLCHERLVSITERKTR